MLDDRGRVAGVVTARLDSLAVLKKSGALPENVGFALRANYAMAFLKSVRVDPMIEIGPAGAPLVEKDVTKAAQAFTVLVFCGEKR